MVKGEWFMVSHSTFTRKIWKLRKYFVLLQQKSKDDIAKKTIDSWKTFKYEFGKFMVDIAKLVFGGVILAGIMSQDINHQLLFALGSCIVVSFALIGLLIISKNKEA